MYGERKGVTVMDCSKVQLGRRKIVLAGEMMRLEPFDFRYCGISIITYFQNSAGQGLEPPEIRSDMRKELHQITSKGPFQPALF